MFLVTSPIVINVPTRGLLAVETMYAIVQWLANLNIKRNVCKQETSLYKGIYNYLIICLFLQSAICKNHIHLYSFKTLFS